MRACVRNLIVQYSKAQQTKTKPDNMDVTRVNEISTIAAPSHLRIGSFIIFTILLLPTSLNRHSHFLSHTPTHSQIHLPA
ncbi:hypothetical protein MIMGU_mgv11b014526mg [Erythranthe guttata]|uniref:Uncharacterized protein n=1 Tax=Erythranthe guttata TaxID=4155 RepID=A0A022RWR0_ERYGU|nr:hypothetical protein MIMGU_mgv11b014526mg [Erythranthe guttata]